MELTEPRRTWKPRLVVVRKAPRHWVVQLQDVAGKELATYPGYYTTKKRAEQSTNFIDGNYQGPCPRCGRPIYELTDDSRAHVGC